ncbi:DNA polymerase I [Natribacillus halophilus]|uniref:DNA polymerase I n=1 Tax=Natribacillus halophilus TaxID=549003 RepID=A0A1G8RY30_9BACI|nr:DNA polymerase I [Natribacillus halophilus]SDJ21876.1 DNA polymerase I [Natribacillus halophilus]
MNKLVLVDGNSVAYRAFYALPLLSNDKGIYTNAVYGFTTMLLKILEEEQPTHMLIAFDAGKTTFRHEQFEDYKSDRQKTPPELSEQLPIIQEVLQSFTIAAVQVELYEADDIIGTLASRAEEKNWQVRVYTGDKDLLQLVTDETHIAITKKGITNVEWYDPKAIDERYGIPATHIPDMKGLGGDSSDNIPGVPNIGEKTALKLLGEYGAIENVLDHADDVSGPKMRERLKEYREQALMSKQLAVINREAPVELELDKLAYNGYDSKQVRQLFKEYGFNSLMNQITTDEDIEEEEAALEDFEFQHEENITDEMLVSPAALIVEVPVENYHNAEVWGVAIANKNGSFTVPAAKALASESFRDWLADETKEKYLFDAKRVLVACGWKDIEIKGVSFDGLIASYLWDPSLSAHDMADIAERRDMHTVLADESVYGKGAKFAKPDTATLNDHLARKAATLWKLKEGLVLELGENEQSELFSTLELPLTLVLAEMELQGISADEQQLVDMGEELDERLDTLEKDIHSLAGESFNINSPKQLGPILFEKLELPVIKKTKTGYSTAADVLEKLADEHEIIPKLLHYRQVMKLKSTYIDGLLKVIHEDTKKIHTRFNQAITQTGRLSSAEPNLQNIPVRLEEGRKIRKAFVPSEPDWVIMAADYSQIELRVLAHISGDEKLKTAFHEGQDIHTKTAMDVFDVERDDITDTMRRHAKAVNFGIVYGISDYGLSQSLGITRKEARSFIDRYFESYPKVKAYMNEAILQARDEGFVTTLLNRRRYLSDINNRNFNLRSFAERTAMNTPIQGTAADIIKKAMIDVAERLYDQDLRSRLLLQVHDELIFEVPPTEIEHMQKLAADTMTETIALDVPLIVDVEYGKTWYEAK